MWPVRLSNPWPHTTHFAFLSKPARLDFRLLMPPPPRLVLHCSSKSFASVCVQKDSGLLPLVQPRFGHGMPVPLAIDNLTSTHHSPSLSLHTPHSLLPFKPKAKKHGPPFLLVFPRPPLHPPPHSHRASPRAVAWQLHLPRHHEASVGSHPQG